MNNSIARSRKINIWPQLRLWGNYEWTEILPVHQAIQNTHLKDKVQSWWQSSNKKIQTRSWKRIYNSLVDKNIHCESRYTDESSDLWARGLKDDHELFIVKYPDIYLLEKMLKERKSKLSIKWYCPVPASCPLISYEHWIVQTRCKVLMK